MQWYKLKYESCGACGGDSEVGATFDLGTRAARICLNCILGALVHMAGGERAVFGAAALLAYDKNQAGREGTA